MIKLSRRGVLTAGAGGLVAATGAVRSFVPARADDVESHGMSAFGDLKYPADFKHFDYVNPNAPKGGIFSQIGPNRQFNQSFLTFNSLNSYILKGDGAHGHGADLRNPDGARRRRAGCDVRPCRTRGARVARTAAIYRFSLRPEARFHDGSKLTAHDVVFSLAVLKEKGHPIIRQLLREFEGAEATDDTTVVARFTENRARDVPLFVASLPIFSRAYYAGRAFDETTMDVPLGSGLYRVGRFESGRFIEYDRVKDWWGADLPVMRGLFNFDTVRFEYYRDREVAFEGFTGQELSAA